MRDRYRWRSNQFESDSTGQFGYSANHDRDSRMERVRLESFLPCGTSLATWQGLTGALARINGNHGCGADQEVGL